MKYFTGVAVLLMLIVFAGCSPKEKETKELKTQKDKASYIIGYDIGENVRGRNMEIDLDALFRGIEEGLKGSESIIPENESLTIMDLYERDRIRKVENLMKEQGEINKVEGEEFLAKNKDKPGIKTFKSGVQMQMVEEGSGKKPTRENTVVILYVGKFLDGKVFDQQTNREMPLEMPMSSLLPGQQQVLLEMKEGGKAIAFVPPNMAFGKHGGGELIPPHTTLIYEMELIEVK